MHAKFFLGGEGGMSKLLQYCHPMRKNHFIRWTHRNISFRFQVAAQRLKKIRFSQNYITFWWNLSFCCGLNFNAIDLPNSSFEPLYPNVSGAPQKFTWHQQFSLQLLPKWGDADLFRLKKTILRCFFGLNSFPSHTVNFRLNHVIQDGF